LTEDVDEQLITSLAGRCEDFSAREIEKYIISCHDRAFSLPEPLLNA